MMKRININLTLKTDRNLLRFPAFMPTNGFAPLCHFSTNSVDNNSKPGLKYIESRAEILSKFLNTPSTEIERGQKIEFTKILNKQIKDKYETRISGGFKGYDKKFTITINKDSIRKKYLVNESKKFFESLEENTLYSVLAVGKFKNANGSIVYKSLFESSEKVSKKSNHTEFGYTLNNGYRYSMDSYHFVFIDKIILFYKIWLNKDQIKTSFDEAAQVLNKVFSRRLAENKIINKIGHSVVSPSQVPREMKYLKNDPDSALIFKLDLIDYQKSDLDNNIYSYSSDLNLNIKRISNFDLKVDLLDSESNKLLSFEDKFDPKINLISRRYKNLKLNFVHNEYNYSEVKLKMAELKEMHKDFLPDYKIGTIDLETCISQDNSDLFSVYACAFYVENEIKTYWLGENNLLTGEALIIQMIYDIFHKRLTDNTFYAHNLGRFDGHFLIKTLLDADFEVKATIKDDKTIISLEIKTLMPGIKGGKKKKVTLKIFDDIVK